MTNLHFEGTILESSWLHPDGGAEYIREVSTRLFDRKRTTGPGMRPIPMKGSVAVAGLFHAFEGLQAVEYKPAVLIEAEGFDDQRLVAGIHPMPSLLNVGRCSVNGCVRMELSSTNELRLYKPSGEELEADMPERAHGVLLTALSNLSMGGIGFDPLVSIGARERVRDVVRSDAHQLMIPGANYTSYNIGTGWINTPQ